MIDRFFAILRHFHSKIRSKEGVALITTLIIIALLVAVVVEFNRIAVADLDISGNFGDEKKILYIAISGANTVKELLKLDGLYTENDNLLEDWFKSRPYFDAATSMLDEGRVEGKITDENGKINVNSLVGDTGKFNQTQMNLWKRLLLQQRFSLTEEEINTIIHGVKDWIDGDDEITGIYGVEDSFYLTKGYRSANRPLSTLEEMLLINGVTPDIFYGNQDRKGIRPFFTVYGDGKININTAPLPVLMSLSDSMTEEIALEMDAFRRDKANRPYFQSKFWYKKVWPFQEPLPEESMTVKSSTFTATIRGTLRDSAKEIRTIISRSAEAADIVYWQEM